MDEWGGISRISGIGVWIAPICGAEFEAAKDSARSSPIDWVVYFAHRKKDTGSAYQGHAWNSRSGVFIYAGLCNPYDIIY